METEQMAAKEGIVEWAVQNSPNRYGVKIEGVWYDGFGEVQVTRGELVRVVYEINHGYHDIVRIERIEPTEIVLGEPYGRESASPGDPKDRAIARAVALKAAVCLYQFRSEQDDESVLKTAGRFERWLGATSPTHSQHVLRMI